MLAVLGAHSALQGRWGPGKSPETSHPRPRTSRLPVSNPDVETITSWTTPSTTERSSSKSSKSSKSSGNVLPTSRSPSRSQSPSSAARRALEEEVQRLLQAENASYTASTSSTSNYRLVESKEHLKSLIVEAPVTLVAFGSAGCRSCRSVEPKIVDLARDNPDILFAKVNTGDEGMAALAEGLGVPSLPYFLLYKGSELVANFTANLSTIDVLRAEISNVKECMDPGCEF